MKCVRSSVDMTEAEEEKKVDWHCEKMNGIKDEDEMRQKKLIPMLTGWFESMRVWEDGNPFDRSTTHELKGLFSIHIFLHMLWRNGKVWKLSTLKRDKNRMENDNATVVWRQKLTRKSNPCEKMRKNSQIFFYDSEGWSADAEVVHIALIWELSIKLWGHWRAFMRLFFALCRVLAWELK